MRDHRMTANVVELEKRLGTRLPTDYRTFLLTHLDSLLEHALLFVPPRSGVIDTLLTAEEILRNDDEDRIGIPAKSLLHIGGNLMGGYLYLKVSDDALGQLHYMENNVFREQFTSFSAFLNETQTDVA
ncbi:MAG: SMI1/KNR4 family protein [Opitutaceae bacterium]|nr:SMI1/KNR4 family protein [Opitutaceae bacterium]